jgi:hypothetical protein
MMFLAGWLLHSIPLAAALGLALMATQRQRLHMSTKPLCCSWYAAPSRKIAQRRASTRSTTRRLCRPLGRRFRNRRLYAEPKVRIRLPPAASQRRAPFGTVPPESAGGSAMRGSDPQGAVLQLIGEPPDDQIATEAHRRSGVMQCPPGTPPQTGCLRGVRLRAPL